MNDQKKWVKTAIANGYTKEQVIKILTENKNKQETIDQILKLWDEQKEKDELLKLGFFERRTLKKAIKAIKKRIKKNKTDIELLKTKYSQVEMKNIKDIEVMKNELIDIIVGKDKKPGMISIFNITDESGEEMTKSKLIDLDIEELNNLSEELIEQLRVEVGLKR